MLDAKQQILEQVLTNKFNVDSYLKLCTELFNGLEVLSPYNPSEKVWSEYKFNIASFTNIGRYINGKEKTVILAVELQSGRSVERARSLQRNFVARLLSDSSYDAAIVAFFSADDERWRLSFVRLDYEFAAGRAKELLTPAKRYSYLVGKGEPCHTAMEQLFPIFRDEEYNPTLDKMEEAFSVERVTDDFFKKYKEKYFELKDFLDGNSVFIEEAQLHQFTSEQFAKKLMGQLAFLYFLQKKGWLGVKVLPHIISDKQFKNAFYNHGKAAKEIIPKAYQQTGADEYHLRTDSLMDFNNEEADTLAGCFKSEPWGSGTKTFIRDLCTNCLKLENRNFFDDYLEPLFYEALNHRRGENNYYKRFNCKIPFLNGGLFEPLENYDWKNSKFGIPNELFSNRHIKGDREADGILDIFDHYNFTMNEDEPLEREVAVDPEMLGKIFENLLDAKDRKSKGAFYTPREIVHYMCQESLINYLVNETDIPYEDMKDFIIYGELMKDEDCSKHATNRLIPISVYGKLGVIDKALVNVKVADPAVGSGAFPLGMLSEIVKVRNNITAYYAQQSQNSVDKARIYDQRDPYKLKWQTIKNSIYAVDIEASAVDIAKLRLWLSIVVDENLEPSYEELRYDENVKQRDPHPLPNLDYNIMCGNSLIDEFEGIKLFDDSILNKETHDTTGAASDWQLSLFSDSMDKLVEDLFKEQDRLFGEEDADRKHEIKKNIDKTIDEIIRAKLQRDGNAEGLVKYKESLKQKTKPYFLWKLEFARVFKENGGFDIVIGNPPYGLINKKQNQSTSIFATDNELKFYKNSDLYQPALGGMINIYRLFVCQSYSLLKERGNFSLIFPMAFMCDLSASKLRKYIFANASVNYIEAFPERDNENKRVFEAVKMSVCILGVTKIKKEDSRFLLRIHHDRYVDERNEKTYVSAKELAMIDPNGLTIPIANQREFDLFTKIVKNCIRLGKISKCYTGEIDLSLDKRFIKNSNSYTTMVKGAQVQKFRITNDVSQGEILYLDSQKYLDENNGSRSSHHQFRRIVMQGITGVNEKVRLKMTIIEPSVFCANSVNYLLLQTNDFEMNYILGILNSKLLNWFFAKLSTNSNVNGYEVDNLPIVTPTKDYEKNITYCTNQILLLKNANPHANTTDFEKQIDKMVYELYGLSEDEIKIVEEQ